MRSTLGHKSMGAALSRSASSRSLGGDGAAASMYDLSGAGAAAAAAAQRKGGKLLAPKGERVRAERGQARMDRQQNALAHAWGGWARTLDPRTVHQGRRVLSVLTAAGILCSPPRLLCSLHPGRWRAHGAQLADAGPQARGHRRR